VDEFKTLIILSKYGTRWPDQSLVNGGWDRGVATTAGSRPRGKPLLGSGIKKLCHGCCGRLHRCCGTRNSCASIRTFHHAWSYLLRLLSCIIQFLAPPFFVADSLHTKVAMLLSLFYWWPTQRGVGHI